MAVFPLLKKRSGEMCGGHPSAGCPKFTRFSACAIRNRKAQIQKWLRNEVLDG
jgi:hypothetical protein